MRLFKNHRIFILIPLLLTVQYSFTQTFTVISKTEKSAIPYANVSFFMGDSLAGGTYTNNRGRFEITDSSITKIKISHLNYSDTIIKPAGTSINIIISLQVTGRSLAEVTIYDKFSTSPATIYVGRKLQKRTIANWFNHNDRKLATWAMNCVPINKGIEVTRLQSGHKDGEKFIKSLVFYSKVKSKTKPYIVKAVFYKNNDGKPGEKLPYEIVKELTKQHKKRIDIDVSKHGIILPREGLFIGIEWVGCKEYFKNPDNFVSAEDRTPKRKQIFSQDDSTSNESVFWKHQLRDGSVHWVKEKYDEELNLLTVPLIGLEVYE